MTNYLAKKAMLADLTISQWGARRLDREITDEVNESHGAAKDAGRYNKRLIAKAALEPIKQIVDTARRLHVCMTQPWMDSGTRILPAALYLKYAERMKALHEDFDREVTKFCADYPQHIEDRKNELNGMFRDADYPHPSLIANKFDFEVKVFPVPDPDDFRVALAADHAADIKRDVEKHLKEALSAAMKDAVGRVIEVVGNMAERLPKHGTAIGIDKNGRTVTARFHDSLVENVRELVALLPAFNLTDDPALTQITQRMERELCVEDAQALKDNPQARAVVAQSAADILAAAKQFIA